MQQHTDVQMSLYFVCNDWCNYERNTLPLNRFTLPLAYVRHVMLHLSKEWLSNSFLVFHHYYVEANFPCEMVCEDKFNQKEILMIGPLILRH